MEKFIQELKAEHASILRYWLNNMIDPADGSCYGERDCNEKLIADAPRGCILNGRLLWTLSSGARVFGNEEYKKAAARLYAYIREHFEDKKNGGYFWSLNADGTPLDTKKQGYAQGFMLYGISEYYRISADAQALKDAIAIFERMEKYFYDPVDGGYIEALAADWTPMDDVRLSDKDQNTPKSMNTHLHILEPYTNLYRIWKNDKLLLAIRKLIAIFAEKIIDAKTGHFNLFFDMDWTVKSRIDSYGHDIEGAWLLYEAAEAIEDKALEDKLRPICKRLVDITIAEGLHNGNSIYYEKVDGHLDTDKHWWPQAEALIGFTDTWRLTGEKKYLDLAKAEWEFIKNYIVDKEHGDWVWRVDKDGRRVYNDMKAGFWKCPYHNSRAMLEVLQRITTPSR